MTWMTRSALLAVLASALGGCASVDPGSEETAVMDEDALRVCADGEVVRGIDVSEHQGRVDWAEVRRAGITFAFARVSDGLNHPDTEFQRNWRAMDGAGVIRGAYQYFRPGQDAVAQADLLLSTVGTLSPDDLPPVIDVETANGQPSSVVVSGVRAWIQRVKARTGRDPIVYAAAGFWGSLSGTSVFASQKLWVANYQATCPSMPSTWSDWTFWQHSDRGRVSGISGNVDLDVFNGSLADLQALLGAPAPDAPDAPDEPDEPDAPGGTGCSTDADCNHGARGLNVICANTGAERGTCIDGCHTDADCSNGERCDRDARPHWTCTNAPPALGTPCSSDAECADGEAGTGRVCGASSRVCIVGCHDTAADCPSGSQCDRSGGAWVCRSGATPPPPASNGCPALTYPSGVTIQTVPSAAMTASYANHLRSGETPPRCFLDVSNLLNPNTGEVYDMDVYVAAHFQLSELVGTEVNQGYGNFVLLSPDAVESLEGFRVGANRSVGVNSGFRSPRHQEDVCDSLCGNPLGCAGTCANNSRHMWGDAFDLPLDFYSRRYTQLACDEGFKFAYLESRTHLHVDRNPAYAQCVQQ